MKHGNALVIFVKNIVFGKVKTRLAATLGPEWAFAIYASLVSHTRNVTQNIQVDKFVYYSDMVEDDDAWDERFYKKIQQGPGLGERMMNALKDRLEEGYTRIILIGSDCPALNAQIINDAFQQLESSDVVIGPAFDGGYYLVGMKELYPYLFENMEWSTHTVFETTINRCKSLELVYAVLPQLHDIDEERDLVHLETAGL
jgi:rSAM/selenodomain-associated transferase 1